MKIRLMFSEACKFCENQIGFMSSPERGFFNGWVCKLDNRTNEVTRTNKNRCPNYTQSKGP